MSIICEMGPLWTRPPPMPSRNTRIPQRSARTACEYLGNYSIHAGAEEDLEAAGGPIDPYTDGITPAQSKTHDPARLCDSFTADKHSAG